MSTQTPTPANIWLIEDNASDILLTRMILEDECVNLALTPLKGGQTASARISEPNGPVPDAIFMDLNMPDINGTDILKQLRADIRYDNVNIFILSGSDAESDRNTAENLGADGYITKPLSRTKILDAVDMVPHLAAIDDGRACHIVSHRRSESL